MSVLKPFWSKIRSLGQRGAVKQKIDEELRFHIEQRTAENVAAGMSSEEAAREARKRFGNVQSVREECRDLRGASFGEATLRDIRFGLRQLRKSPGFTTVAVLTLALGIGATTAMFSVVYAVVLRPLPYPESDRLVWMSERSPNFPVMAVSFPNFNDWRAQQTIFERIGVYNWASYNLTGDGDPLRLRGALISADALAALKVRPALGRLFREDEDKAGAAPVALLSHSLWNSRFGGTPDVVNRTINLDGSPCTVIGVMPAEFVFPSPVDIWVPLGRVVGDAAYQNRGNHPGLMGIARLKPGVTLPQARAEMDTIAARLEKQYPENRNCGVRIDTLIENRVGSTARAALWTIFGAVAMVLLIACGNVANLLLARGAARQKEMAVRAALGAGRRRIIRQLLTESLLLSLSGGALGFLLANWGLGLILAVCGDALPRANEVRLDTHILVFNAIVSLVTGIFFGLAPAWQADRPDTQEVLKETARGVTRAQGRMRHALVVSEVALTLLLLVGAGLMLRTFHRLQTLDPGFSHERVLSFRLDLSPQKYGEVDQQIGFYKSLVEKLRALPGVQQVGVAYQFPLAHEGWQTGFLIEGQPEPPPGQRPSMELTPVSPDYFQAMGIRLLRGRFFTDADNRDHLRERDLSGLNDGQRRASGLNAIIVDEEFARRHWPNEDPIGKRILMPAPALTVVGVVSRVKMDRLGEQGGFVQAYLPLWQYGGTGRAVVMKTALPPETLISAVRQEVRSLDPEQPIYEMRTLAAVRHDSLAPQRLNLVLLGLFAGVALTLAVIGLYGVLAYTVTQRTREIGIRMALGASRRNVLGLVLGSGMKLAGIGIVLGGIGALGLTRVLTAQLYEVKPADPVTFAAVVLLMVIVALIACAIPARRAAKVDPMVALRCE